ncbi:MAG: hypothetical protein ABIH39_08570 [Candidatus Margulisiibacteriota bacterium]
MKNFIKTTIILVLVFTLHLTLNTLNSYAAVPHLLSYQGRLTGTDGSTLNGSYTLTFRIYDAETAGNLLWEENQTGVLVQKGMFNILLGSVTNLNLAFDKPYFLEIKVGSEVMNARQRINSVGYAIRAERADSSDKADQADKAVLADDVISLPKGIIAMWSGNISNIPAGWALCNGSSGTPDLRNRFVVGAGQDETGVAKTNLTGGLTKTGGSVTITAANLPSHTHGVGTLVMNKTGAHTHEVEGGTGGGYPERFSSRLNSRKVFETTSSNGEHSHTLSGATAATGSNAVYTQPYYALAYIMKL